MSFVISSILPFPNIVWWCTALKATTVKWDISEHFEKMTYRNRYFIASANGLQRLTIPILKGRDHHVTMNEIRISTTEPWQKQHWRTIESAYNRSPYFSFYAPALNEIFQRHSNFLTDFNLATIHRLKKLLEINWEEEIIQDYQKNYPEALSDLRNLPRGLETCTRCDFPLYYQVFQERNGFLPNLSILDLLFSEGPFTRNWLQQNEASILYWANNPAPN